MNRKRVSDVFADVLETLGVVIGYSLATLGSAVAFSWLLSL